MFGRQVTMKLKGNATTELTRILNSEVIPLLLKQKGFREATTLIAPERLEAITNSVWDTKDDAEAYNHTGYGQVLKILSSVIEGTPTLKTFEVVTITAQKGTAAKVG